MGIIYFKIFGIIFINSFAKSLKQFNLIMRYLFLITLFCFNFFSALAQNENDSTTQPNVVYKVVVLAPIFIDSAFNGETYKVVGNTMPRNILPGLDFYNGVMMAVDSLQKEKMPLEILFFDTKSKTMPMKKIMTQKFWDSVSLIISYFKENNEIKPLADLAKSKKIPLISVTYPNNGGVADNNYFVLLNPTLHTHCEGLYKYIQSNYSTGKLVYIKRRGKLENDIENIFKEMKDVTQAIPLNYTTVELTDTFSLTQLRKALDSSINNIIICGTVNEKFGLRLVNSLDQLKNFKKTVIGMPTFDGIKELNTIPLEGAAKGSEIIYSSPYNFVRENGFGKYLTDVYNDKFFARASDWFLKAYEATYKFCHHLIKYKQDFIQNLSSNDFNVFTNFNIQPVLNNNDVPSINYFENKKLYFYKKQDGILKSVE